MSNNGVVSIPTQHTVKQTVQKLKELLAAKGVKLFAMIDHSGGAEKAGLSMLPCKLPL